jgi:hypothetical protein
MFELECCLNSELGAGFVLMVDVVVIVALAVVGDADIPVGLRGKKT